MREMITFSDAIHKRLARAQYTQLAIASAANGRKMEKSFEDLFPQYYRKSLPAQKASPFDEKADSLMDEIALKNIAKMEEDYGRRQQRGTTNKNQRRRKQREKSVWWRYR